MIRCGTQMREQHALAAAEEATDRNDLRVVGQESVDDPGRNRLRHAKLLSQPPLRAAGLQEREPDWRESVASHERNLPHMAALVKPLQELAGGGAPRHASSKAMLVEGVELRHRLRAARELAGYESPAALGNALKLPKLSGRTINSIESGKRPALRHELREIAHTCGLPLEWFEVDIRAAVTAAANASDAVPRPTGALGRELQELPPNGQNQQQTPHRRARGDRP